MYKETIRLTTDGYTHYVTALKALHIKKRPYSPLGCIGGGSDYITLCAESNKEIKEHIVYCSGDVGDLDGDIAAATALFREIVPDLWEKLMKQQKIDKRCTNQVYTIHRPFSEKRLQHIIARQMKINPQQ